MIIVHSNKTISRNQLPAFQFLISSFPYPIHIKQCQCSAHEHTSSASPPPLIPLAQAGLALHSCLNDSPSAYFSFKTISVPLHSSTPPSQLFICWFGGFLELAPIRHALRVTLPQAPPHHAQRCFNISLPRARESGALPFRSKGESVKGEKGGGAKKKKEKKKKKEENKFNVLFCFFW